MQKNVIVNFINIINAEGFANFPKPLLCIISRKCLGKHLLHVNIFDSASIRTHERERDKETSEVVQYIKQSTRNIVGGQENISVDRHRKMSFPVEEGDCMDYSN